MYMRLICSTLLAVLVAGCGGWHLRGQGPIKGQVSSVFLKENNADLVGQAVRRELFNRGMRVARERRNADVIIELDGERFERRILSVDPETGKVREIELGLETYFSVRSQKGTLLIPREPLTWQLDYVFDEGSLLGTVEQDTTVQTDLAEIAATSVVFRLDSLSLPPSERVPAQR